MGSLPQWAWSYLQSYGVVENQCVPYTSEDGDVESCTYDQKSCTTGAPWKLYYVSNYTHVGSLVNPSEHVTEIMKAVMEGPVDATFDVWGDFDDYNGGVYSHQSGEYEGLHSVKIIGWGVEGGVDYWLVQNSWGASWGPDGGFFKIKKGVDECFIESLVYTGYPAL
uniref:Peptidase C1A papain C-terminal domain-containing protein n=1 Tax=Arcella intermedia TaxID=1963864 RepID=A0A6B2LG61_9EUKA